MVRAHACDLFLPARPGCGLLARLDFEDVRHPAHEAEPRAGDVDGDEPLVGDLALDVARVGLAPEPRVVVRERAAVGRVHTVRPVVPAAVLARDVARQDAVVGEVLEVLVDPGAGRDESAEDQGNDHVGGVARPPPGHSRRESQKRKQHESETQSVHDDSSMFGARSFLRPTFFIIT